MEIQKYFKKKAITYDEDCKKPFWKLSDELLWCKFNELLKTLPENFTFLDVGGGTGEWSKRILESFAYSSGEIVDFSDEMLEKAKLKTKMLSNRIQINKVNILDNWDNTKKFDVVFNFYVLPFCGQENQLINQSFKSVKKNGLVISVFENYYQNLALTVLTGNMDNVEEILISNKSKMINHIPSLYFHKTEHMKKIYLQNHLVVKKTLGFPILSQVGIREKITGKNNSISDVLKAENDFSKIFEIEKTLMNDEALVNRGKYIMIVGRRE